VADLSLNERGFSPPQVLALGYLVLISVGTVLLMTPLAVNGEPLSWVDALFTATSATAVTGLVVVDTGTYLSFFGQMVVLTLIQAGGLGFMMLSTLIFLLLGRRIGFRERLLIQQTLNTEGIGGIIKLSKLILFFTFSMEVLGALILTLRWAGTYGWGKAIWYGIFHSISAFCNAGFELTGRSMMPFVGDWVISMTIAGLFILGGLGFGVVAETYRKQSWRHLSLHSKLVYTVTALLLFLGFLGIYLGEFDNPATLGKLAPDEKVLASFFQAATPRTAGFNSLVVADFRHGTILMVMILMMIGASPGSTGGGLKTTTVAALLAAVKSAVRGQRNVQVFQRRLKTGTVIKALSIIVISLGIVLGVTLVLLETEQAGLEPVLFEVISAFNTVGLSLGLTPELSPAGRVLLSLTMFVGRLGPLTIAYALTQNRGEPQKFNYPEENILIG